MIHKIKGLHDNGTGLSIRAISEELGVSRNTVRKYLRMDAPAIGRALEDRARAKRLDRHRAYLVYLLGRYPRLSAVKVARKLREQVGEIDASERSIRRYVQTLKRTVVTRQPRYYEPVLDSVPGVQCQVDPGELRGVRIGEAEHTLYFVVFVLSFSRLMYVGLSLTPIDTTGFIRLHDEALRYFGGVPGECVYDQTKMVVIAEQFRELTVNPRFHAYATAAGFRIHACEGYDPESKGKVEAGVKYVKQDCLYGEVFADHSALRAHVQQWLEEVANARTHATTGRVPRTHFAAEEQARLRGYLTPACVGRAAGAGERRKADKTGLIAWRANKYSVPMAYQQAAVGVCEHAGALVITDLESAAVVATHPVCTDKGRVIKNTHHYRDHGQRLADLEAALRGLLGQPVGERLCRLLKTTSPRIYKDQLVAVRHLLRAQPAIDPDLMAQLALRETLTATPVKRYLEAATRARERGRDDSVPETGRQPAATSLSQYARVGRSGGPEVTHERA